MVSQCFTPVYFLLLQEVWHQSRELNEAFPIISVFGITPRLAKSRRRGVTI